MRGEKRTGDGGGGARTVRRERTARGKEAWGERQGGRGDGEEVRGRGGRMLRRKMLVGEMWGSVMRKKGDEEEV